VKLLEELTQTPSVPGREDRIRQVILKHVKKHVDDWRVDAMGNLITVRKPTKKTKDPNKVMLAAHMDQIGFLVSHIDDKGHLRLNAVGGFDTRNLFARRVRVCAAEGDLPGVMNPGGKPIHIASEEDKKKIPDVSDFFVDLGLKGAEVRKKVKIGDMVVLDGPFGQVGNNVVSQCLDNRVGCWAVIKTLQNIGRHACEIHAVFTVQEEVGLRGAGPAAYGVDPDLGVSCDTTLCCQTPGVPEEQRVTELGAGVCLKIMDSSTIADLGLIEQVENVAARHKIKSQRGVLTRGGQDGAMIQRARRGVRTVVFACPVKYIHTVTEMSSRDDLESYHRLLAAWLQTI
jgi:endoglucanase